MLWLIFVVSIYGFAGPPVWFYNAPSTSMAETIMIGDVYVADTDIYARKDPERGDVAVFHPHAGDPTLYVKRVIGLPGDRVQMVDGRLVLNGTPVSREPGREGPIAEAPSDARRYFETLPNGARYETLDFAEGGFLDDTRVFDVPPGNYFVLGDNRDNSTDSRVADVGFVPRDRFVGRAAWLIYSVDPDTRELRPERLLRPLR
jgi:signal peptidase I